MERLTNLSKLKGVKEFFISCFPVKIEKVGAGWVRVVAFVKKKDVGK
jgi:kynurenine formamidase